MRGDVAFIYNGKIQEHQHVQLGCAGRWRAPS
jgi:hypothetical protein